MTSPFLNFMELRDNHSKELKAARDRADTLAAMLCEAMAFLDKQPQLLVFLSQATRDWWDNYKKHDAEVKAREEEKRKKHVYDAQEKERRRQLILSATAKLTAEEREAIKAVPEFLQQLQ